jgi:LysR family nitrogen assimilation transcriptional regulator
MQAIGQHCPGVHLTLAEGLSPNLTERVFSGALDFAVVFNPPNDARLNQNPLLEEELFLIGRSDVIGKTSAPVAFADIPQGAVLGLRPVEASRAIIQAQILRNQITPSPRLEIDSLNAMRKALEAGLGCAILARSTVGAELSVGRVHARRIVDPTLTRTLTLITLADHPRTRAFVEVRDVLNHVFDDEIRSGRWPAEAIGRGGRTGRAGHRRPKSRSQVG